MLECGRNFAKEHLAVCLVKDAICTSYNVKGHFTKNCISRRKKNGNVLNNHEIVDTELVNPLDQPPVNNNVQKKGFWPINARSETGQNDDEDYSVLNVTTIFDNDEKELKKLLNFGLEKENFVQLKRQVASASPVSFLKRNVLREIKLRYPHLKINEVDQATKRPLLRLLG